MRGARVHAGFTLVEVMLASAIFVMLTLAFFEGVIVSTRIARENSQILAAEAVAWDAVWKRFNERYEDLTAESTGWQNLSSAAAPELSVFDTTAKIKIDVYAVNETGWLKDMKEIAADVEWGQANRRKRLSQMISPMKTLADGTRYPVLLRRGNLGRAP